MKQLLLIAVALVGMLAGCKKSDDAKSDNKLVGKWNLEKYVSNWSQNGVTNSEEQAYDPGDYIEFRDDGTCTLYVDNTANQTYWQLLNDGKTLRIASNNDVDVPDEGYEIKTLTRNNLTLYYKEVAGAGYDEIFIYLNK